VGGCVVSAGGAAQARRPFDRTAPWGDYERIDVRSRNGAVDLKVGSGTDVTVSGELYASAATHDQASRLLEELDVTVGPADGEPRTLVIAFDPPDWGPPYSAGATIRVVVPQPCPAVVRTRNGQVRAVGLVGPARLETRNGAVVAEDINGDLHAETANGAINARTITGGCELQTSNGDIRAHDVRGQVLAETSNGRIDAKISPPPDGRVILRSSNGPIDATLPGAMTAELRLRTSNGRAQAHFGQTPVEIRRQSRTQVEAITNGGGPGRVEATTSNGAVTVRLD
jgi:hypothetical protein